jgi:L-asparaginase
MATTPNLSEAEMLVEVVTAGGTIDKNYSPESSGLYEDHSFLKHISDALRLQYDWKFTELLRRDSLELDDEDRELICQHVIRSSANCIIVTHGTDTMVRTARYVSDALLSQGSIRKTVVFTGAFLPGRFSPYEASFNLGSAFIAARLLNQGVYIVIGGEVLEARSALKDTANQRFIRGDSDATS